jgi:xylulokinase
MLDLLVGVDLGTTATKTAVYDETGKQLAEAVESTPLRWHGRHACDQDPNDFYKAAIGTIRCCLEQGIVDASRVVAIGIAGQMAGVMGVDADFEPSTPYDSWLDRRCVPQVEYLDRGIGDELTEETGCPPMVDHAPKMRWWKECEPSAYARTAKFVMPGGYVAARLAGLSAGDAFIDHTYLHFTGVASAREGRWSDDLIEVVGVDRDKLPIIVPPTTRLGMMCPEAAAATGLSRDVIVAAGLGDTAAGALGAGIVGQDQALDVAGTAAVFAGSTTEFRPDTEHRTLLVMRGAVEGQWISLAYLSGGDLLSWFATSVVPGTENGSDVDLDSLTDGVRTLAAGSSGLLFIPFLDGRILPSNDGMRGAWLGLSRDHSHKHMLRALLESVPFEYAGYVDILRQLHPHWKPSEIRVAGGGGRSRVWDQIKASVLGLPYQRLDRDELGCWGAALVAGKAAGLFDDLAAAAVGTTGVAERIEPDRDDRQGYADLLPLYRSSITAMEETFGALAQLQLAGMKGNGDA